MKLADDVARCAGVGSDADGWRDGCDTCLRRLCPGGRVQMDPPPIIVFECEYQIEDSAAVTGEVRSTALLPIQTKPQNGGLSDAN
jgi:hypothetical protein